MVEEGVVLVQQQKPCQLNERENDGQRVHGGHVHDSKPDALSAVHTVSHGG